MNKERILLWMKESTAPEVLHRERKMKDSTTKKGSESNTGQQQAQNALTDSVNSAMNFAVPKDDRLQLEAGLKSVLISARSVLQESFDVCAGLLPFELHRDQADFKNEHMPSASMLFAQYSKSVQYAKSQMRSKITPKQVSISPSNSCDEDSRLSSSTTKFSASTTVRQ